jgi:hypothetical protein
MLFLASAVQTFAIEGLQLQVSLQSSNAVLSWPSQDGETYFVQYRPTIGTNDPWQTLTNSLPADSGTNITYFIHSNAVQFPTIVSTNNGGTNGSGGGPPFPGGGGTNGSPYQWAPGAGYYQVARDGVHVIGLSNLLSSPVSDTITFTFEAANSVGTVQDANVMVDGAWSRGASAIFGSPFSGTLTVDTSFLENGDHTFQIVVGWLNPDVGDANNFMFQRQSDPFTLTVSNAVFYPEWVDSIPENGPSAYFAETIYTNADWQIDIYDVGTNHVKTLTGHTTNGIIEAYWDLMDESSVMRTNIDTDPEFSATFSVASKPPKKSPPKPKDYPYPAHGTWAIAYQDTFQNMANSNRYYNAFSLFGSIGADFGGAYTVLPSNPTNGQTWPMRYPISTNADPMPEKRWADDRALRTLLTNRNCRNFYYNGHGGPNNFGYFMNTSALTADLKHQPYRFVFLDGCFTANGGLSGAFGIGFSQEVDIDVFQKSKSRPRAFLGYSKKVYYYEGGGNFFDSDTGGTYSQRVRPEIHEFLTNFEFYWSFGYGLYLALDNAIYDTPSLPDIWQNGKALKLFGYYDLGVDEYNVSSDWP